MIIREAIKFKGFMEEIFTSSGKNADILANKYPQMLKNATELGKRGWVLFLLPKPIQEQINSLSPDEIDREMTAVYSLGSMNEDIKYVLVSAISDYRNGIFSGFQSIWAWFLLPLLCGNHITDRRINQLYSRFRLIHIAQAG